MHIVRENHRGRKTPALPAWLKIHAGIGMSLMLNSTSWLNFAGLVGHPLTKFSKKIPFSAVLSRP
jgi:hypothetical protein